MSALFKEHPLPEEVDGNKSSKKPLPEELLVMPANLRILEFIGLWGSWDNFYRFVVLFLYAFSIIFLPKLVDGIGSSDSAAIIKGIAEFVFEASIYVPIVIFAVKRRTFEKLMDEFEDFFRKVTIDENFGACYDIIVDQNNKIKTFFKFYLVYCLSAPFAYSIPSLFGNHVHYWTRGNTTEPLILELPAEQEFYGMQIRTSFSQYHYFLAISVPAHCVSTLFSLLKITTAFFMIKYSSLTYRVVAARVQKLAQLEEITISDLAEVVELHEQAFQITELVEEMGHIPIAMEFLTCIVYWCLTMLYASTRIDFNLFNVMVLFFASLMETFGYSYLGSDLTNSADAVGEAVYDLPWYEHSVELQRYYKLIIRRTQRSTCISGIKFFVVELTTFSNVMNMSYSYYLVLKDVLNTM
ncbi:hypothetical protein pipiens_006313 [Culex pipiens pipiens]|uniref:Odorant receptor n=1 Tax=Culex pipiens pipiens TaxID=38569 RepID=A0ABD1DQ99_CULPP